MMMGVSLCLLRVALMTTAVVVVVSGFQQQQQQQPSLSSHIVRRSSFPSSSVCSSTTITRSPRQHHTRTPRMMMMVVTSPSSSTVSLKSADPPRQKKKIPRHVVVKSIFSMAFISFVGLVVRSRAPFCILQSKLVAALALIQSNKRFFLTIPILAGVCNALTNKLAVWMMFYPIQKRLGCYQGIVPKHVRRMGADISDMLLGELLNVKQVLGEIDATTFAELLLMNDKLLTMCQDVVLDILDEDESYSSFLSYDTKQRLVQSLLLTKERLSRVIARAVVLVQEDAEACIDLKHQVVTAMAANPQLIVHLFETCGKNELSFMVSSGGVGGFLFGIGQLLAYALYPRAWTLVLGGGFVGWATDTLALKIMFWPLNPVRLFRGFTFQGLFLQRQEEVSNDFATFTETEILPPRALWKALLTGPRRDVFISKVQQAISAEIPFKSSDNDDNDDDNVDELIEKMARGVVEQFDVSVYATPTFDYLQTRLGLRERIRSAMASLPSARFERVLHPVFEQDEATLIAVGSILGALVGLMQAVFGR